MAFKLVGGTAEPFAVELTVTAGTAIAEGDLLDFNGNVVQRATSSSTIHSIFAVAAETISTTATKIKAIVVCPGMIWQADTANNTDGTELYEGMALTDHDTVSAYC